jgi:hypothetical protein
MATAPRVEITEKALKILKIESALTGQNQKDALETLILRGASAQTQALLQDKPIAPKTPKMDILEDMAIATNKPLMEKMEVRSAPATTRSISLDMELTKPALMAILEDLKKGNEPTVNQISDNLGLTTTGLGRILSAVGVKAQNTHRENKTVRIYTRNMIPSIEAILSKLQN